MSFDIDFLSINDVYGHDNGDLTLKRFSTLCRESLRQNDLFSRFGGEEFILVLSDPDLYLAYVIAERLISNIETHLGDILPSKPTITVSIGLSTLFSYETVDEALYISKAKGRNKITSLYEDSEACYILEG